MKTVLIIDDEKLFLASLTEGLAAHADEFEVVTANNGKQGLEILDSQPVDLVVTDLKMPVMDGFQMLAAMMNRHWTLPVIVMTAFGTPEIEDQIKDFNSFGYLEKPIDFHGLADKIRAGLEFTDNGIIRGITLPSFLQLLSVERKTCSLKVKAADTREGALHFSEGELLDAACGKLKGEAAASEILSWDNVEIEIVNVFKRLRQTIKKSLPSLMMEAAQEKAEAAALKTEVPDAPIVFLAEAAANKMIAANSESPVLSLPDEFESSAASAAGTNFQPDVGEEILDLNNPQPTIQIHKIKEILTMASNVNEAIQSLMTIDGAVAVALVDRESGMALGQAGNSSVNLEVAAAGNSEVVKSKMKVMNNLGLKDSIEDILITLGNQYHLIRPLATHQNLFFYVVLDRTKANLAMARFKVTEVEKGVTV